MEKITSRFAKSAIQCGRSRAPLSRLRADQNPPDHRLAHNQLTKIDSTFGRRRGDPIAVEQLQMIECLLAQVQMARVLPRKGRAAQVTPPWSFLP